MERSRQSADRSPAGFNEESPSSPTDSGLLRLFSLPRSFGIERRVIQGLLKKLAGAGVAVRLWDGDQIGDPATADVCLTIRSRQALWRLGVDHLHQLPGLYASGGIDLGGDLVKLLRVINEQLAVELPRGGGSSRPRNGSRLHHAETLGHLTTRGALLVQDALPTEFYRHWLDADLVLSCAEFKESSYSLEAAQTAKFDSICRQLKLRPGEVLVDLGCGWGGLALHAARRFGVRVRAITPVSQQADYLLDRAREADLDDLIDVIEGDWHCLKGACDAIACIESLEEIGSEDFAELGGRMRQCLGADGRGLIQVIARNFPQPPSAPWIEQHLLPCVQPPALSQLMEVVEAPGMIVCSLDNLRHHAQRTVREWRARFDERYEFLREEYDEAFLRGWRLYLASLQAAFEAKTLQLFRLRFASGGDIPPLTSLAIPARQAAYAF